GKGDGTFQAPATYSAGEGVSGLALADVTLDGNLDITIGGENTEQVTTLIGKGDGTFKQGPTSGSAKGAYRLAVADLNNDGKPDLGVLNFEGIASVSVLLNAVTAH